MPEESQELQIMPRNEHLGGTYRRSLEFGELAAAMVGVQGELKNPRKDQTADIPTKTGGRYSYSYADLAGVLDSCRESLTKHGIAVFQPILVDRNAVTVSTLLAHKSGQWICSDLTLISGDSSAQGIGSAVTYARRYGLTSLVGIAGEDDDGAGASVKSRPIERRQPSPAKTFKATDADLPEELQAAQSSIVPKVISEAQRGLLKEAARAGQLADSVAKQILLEHGFHSSKDVTEDRFDEIRRALRGEPEAVPEERS